MGHTMEENITACLGVASSIASTLGPCGMDKLIVSDDNDGKRFTVSNDGATILRHLTIEHPAAKLFIELSQSQDAIVGDGTTSTVLLAAGLLHNAHQLLLQGWHPTYIIEYYRKYLACAVQIIHDISMPLTDAMLHDIAKSSIGSKVLRNYIHHFSELGVKATAHRNIRVATRVGHPMLHSRLVDGVLLVLRDRIPHYASSSYLLEAHVLVTSAEVLRQSFWNGATVKVNNYADAYECGNDEANLITSQCQLIAELGVQVVVALGPVSPVVEQFFAQHKILLIVVHDSDELGIVSLCTGCEVVSDLQARKIIGLAHKVEVISYADSDVVMIGGVDVCTVELHAPSYDLAQECKRSMEDMLRVLKAVKSQPKVVGGGGSITLEVARRIRDRPINESTQKAAILRRLVVQAFANTCEAISYQLATNAGSGEHIVEEAKQMHVDGVVWAGIDSRGLARDMVSPSVAQYDRVIEPAAVIIAALTGAVDVAELILRIDTNVVAPPRQRVNM